MNNGKGVNRRADSGRTTVVDRDSLRDAIENSSRTSMRQHMQGDLGLEPRVCGELSLNMEPSSVLLWKRTAHACYPRQAS